MDLCLSGSHVGEARSTVITLHCNKNDNIHLEIRDEILHERKYKKKIHLEISSNIFSLAGWKFCL